MTTELCRLLWSVLNCRECSIPGACFLQCFTWVITGGKYWVSGTGRAASSHPWAKSKALNRQEDWEAENRVTFLSELLRLQAGPTVSEAEAQPRMDGRIFAFKCRIGAFKCSMKMNLKHSLAVTKVRAGSPWRLCPSRSPSSSGFTGTPAVVALPRLTLS